MEKLCIFILFYRILGFRVGSVQQGEHGAFQVSLFTSSMENHMQRIDTDAKTRN